MRSRSRRRGPWSLAWITRVASLLLLCGCRQQATPDQARGTDRPGIFHGTWVNGTQELFSIRHELGQTPVISIPAPSGEKIRIAGVQARGRTLHFEQHAAPSRSASSANATSGPTLVTLQIAMNATDYAMFEVQSPGQTNVVTQYITRVVPARPGETEDLSGGQE